MSADDDGQVLVATFALLAESEEHANGLIDRVSDDLETRRIQKVLRRRKLPYWGDVDMVGRAVTAAGMPPANFPYYEIEEVNIRSDGGDIEVVEVWEDNGLPQFALIICGAVFGVIMVTAATAAAVVLGKRRFDAAVARAAANEGEPATPVCFRPGAKTCSNEVFGSPVHPESPDLSGFNPWMHHHQHERGNFELSRFGSPVVKFWQRDEGGDSDSEEREEFLSPANAGNDASSDDDELQQQVGELDSNESPVCSASRKLDLSRLEPSPDSDSDCLSPAIATAIGDHPYPDSPAPSRSRHRSVVPRPLMRPSRLADLDSISVDLDARISSPRGESMT